MKFGTMVGLACMYKGPWNKCDRTVHRRQKKFLPEKVTKFWNSKISEFLKWIPDLPPQKMVHLRWRWPEKNQLQLIDQNFLNCGWNIFFEKFAPHRPGTVRPTATKFGTMVDLVDIFMSLQGNYDRMIGIWKKSIFPENKTKFWNSKKTESWIRNPKWTPL